MRKRTGSLSLRSKEKETGKQTKPAIVMVEKPMFVCSFIYFYILLGVREARHGAGWRVYSPTDFIYSPTDFIFYPYRFYLLSLQILSIPLHALHRVGAMVK